MSDLIFKIADVGTGSLFIGPRPKLGEFPIWLKELKSLGIVRVVSFLENSEIDKYSLQGEARALADELISYTRFPIPDYGLPDPTALSGLLSALHGPIVAGENLLLHCAGGHGRAGTVASCLLVSTGMHADEAIALVSEKRGVDVPETDQQRTFIQNFKPELPQ